jgi:hypothetical protein
VCKTAVLTGPSWHCTPRTPTFLFHRRSLCSACLGPDVVEEIGQAKSSRGVVVFDKLMIEKVDPFTLACD